MEFLYSLKLLIIVIAMAILWPVLAKICLNKRLIKQAWILWMVVLAGYAVGNWLLLDDSPYLRMTGLCMWLLSGMKCITYQAWLSKHRGDIKAQLSWCRWLGFAWLWFGMSVQPWVKPYTKRPWLRHALCGLLCVVMGVLWMYCCYLYEITHVLPIFIGLSLAFHYGCLRLLMAWWRLCGVPVKLLFRNPLRLTGFRDFWSKRWNLGYSQMMAVTVQKPLMQLGMSFKGSLLMVFIISGLLHELAISVPAKTGYGLPFLVFLVHGLLTLLELKWPHPWLYRIGCFIILLVGMPYLFPQEFNQQILIPSVEFVGENLTRLINEII